MTADGLQIRDGTHLYLQKRRSDGVTEVLPCVVKQSIEGQEVVVSPQGIEGQDSFVSGEAYTMRLVENEKRYAFTTTILNINRGMHPLIRLSYPREMDTVSQRKSVRHQLSTPLRLSLRAGEETLTVYVHDISRGGASLIAESSLAKGDDVLNIELRSPIDHSLINLRCLVRYVMFDMNNGVIIYRHGVEFQIENDDEQMQIDRLIDFMLNEKHHLPTSSL